MLSMTIFKKCDDGDDDHQIVIKIDDKGYKCYLRDFIPPFQYLQENSKITVGHNAQFSHAAKRMRAMVKKVTSAANHYTWKATTVTTSAT